MNENTNPPAQAYDADQQTRAEAQSVSDLARTMVLAGIGAMALAKDEAKSMMNRMVARGAAAQREARKRMETLGERSKKQGDQAQARMEKQVEGVLARMNIPTKDDIASLNTSVSILSAKIDVLLAHPGTMTGSENQPLPPIEPMS